MNLYTLFTGTPDKEARENGIAWAGRQKEEGIICLEEEVEKRLLRIRGDHMRWAYETGFLNIGDATLAAILECGESPSMWWTSLLYERHPKLSPYLYVIYKIRALELLLLEKNCHTLVYEGNDARLKNTLAQLCHFHKWTFQSHAGKKSSKSSSRNWKMRLYWKIPAFLRAICRFLFWRFSILARIGRLDEKKWNKKNSKKSGNELTATIVSYFPNLDLPEAGWGRFVSRYWESLHELLNRLARENGEKDHFVRWLFIRFPAPGLTLDQCVKLKDKFQETGKDGLSFNYLEEFLTRKDIAASLRRWLKLIFASLWAKKSFADNCRFAGSGFNFWLYMREQWGESFQGWRCLERCLQNRAFKRFFKLAGKQRWVLYPLENCPWERMCVVAAREENPDQPVYGSQHSIVRPTDFRYFDDPATFSNPETNFFQPDIIGGNGSDACSQLLENGMPKSRARQLEALRYLYLAGFRKPENSPASGLPPQEGEPVEAAAKKRLLVLTSFFEDETAAHLHLLGEALQAGILTDWEVALKPHPFLGVEDWLSALPKDIAKGIRIVTGSMETAFTPNSLVWTSNSTTASLEAILRKLPLMVMRPMGDFDLCPVQNISGLPRTGNLAEVQTALNNRKIIDLPHDYLDLNTDLSAWQKLLETPHA